MKRIAFLSFDWDYDIVTEYYLGTQDYLKGRDDLQVVIFNAFGYYYASHRPKKSTFEIFSICDPDDFDGFLIQGNRTWPPALRQEFVDRAVALGKPVVSINYDLEGAHSVGTDNYQEEYKLVHRVLSDSGVTRAAFVNGLKTSVEAQDRAQAYRDACEKLGVIDARFYQANWQIEAGVVTANKILRKPNDLPEVVFCCNDDIAVGMLETLQSRGVSVPKDIMVTGFDNRDISRRTTPHITTVDRDYRGIIGTALNTIERLLEGEDFPRKVFSPAKHVLTESCGYQTQPDTSKLEELAEVNERYKGFYEALNDFQSSVLDSDSLYSILENCERFAPQLDCGNMYLSLNDEYMSAKSLTDAQSFGPKSHLVACSQGAISSFCDQRHVYASYVTSALLPPEVSFSKAVYTVSPLRHGETCIGTLVTEGVPSIMSHGFLAFFITALSAALESVRRGELLAAR